MKRNKLIQTSLSLFLAGSLLGCASKQVSSVEEQTSQVEEEALTATIKVWASKEDLKEDGWLEKEFKAFEKAHPKWEITFETKEVSENEVVNKMNEDTENVADVYFYTNDQIPTLVNSKMLAEIGGETLQEMNKNNVQTIVDSITYNEATYGIPSSEDTWFMYYDKRVFSSDDVSNLEKMLKKGKVGFPVTSAKYLSAFYSANGCNWTNGNMDFNSDKAIAVTNYLVDLVKNNNFVNYYAEDAYASMLAEGKINALFSDSKDYDTIVSALGEENVGVIAAPTYTLNGQTLQLKATTTIKVIGINPNSKIIKAAVALANFLGSEESQLVHFETNHVLPVDSSPTLEEDSLFFNQLDNINHARMIVQPTDSNMASVWTSFEQKGKDLMSGSVTKTNTSTSTDAPQ